jgi:hypothetical protein
LHRRATCAAVLLIATVATRLGAQSLQIKPFAQLEARGDAILGAPSALQLGLGANVPVDPYVRFGVTVAGGAAWQDGRSGASARADLTVRYLLDPYAESRWGAYGGGGLSVRWERDARWRTYLLLVGGVEGPARGSWRTAFEAGLGGGARIGIVLRRARPNWR